MRSLVSRRTRRRALYWWGTNPQYALFVGDLLGITLAWRLIFAIAHHDGLLASWQPWVAELALGGFMVGAYLTRLYRRQWPYLGIHDLRILLAVGIVGQVPVMAAVWASSGHATLGAAGLALAALVVGALRLSVWSASRAHFRRRARPHRLQPALVVGAGGMGAVLAHHLHNYPHLGYRLVGFVDDDPAKRRRVLAGHPVLGTVADAARVAQQHGCAHVFLALPSAPLPERRRMRAELEAAGLAVTDLPGVHQLLTGQRVGATVRPLQIEQLLPRPTIHTALPPHTFTGQVVLVTGAGGSIGRELCRQLLHAGVERVIAVGRGEGSLTDLQSRERAAVADGRLVIALGDVRDPAVVRDLCAADRPTLILHAAAHKHVPILEEHISEAIINNVGGTLNVIQAARAANVPRVILISTDKAVRPSSIMGATKRLAECLISAAANEGRAYGAVRFGNVLGSRGSVVPLMWDQIRAGGPLTITDARMERYFMTIPEAAGLVLHAAVDVEPGALFVLDMGEPYRIETLARRLVAQAGLQWGTDITVQYTGMRPGEKLSEELYLDPTNVAPTAHPKVLHARGEMPSVLPTEAIMDLVAAAIAGVPPLELRAQLERILQAIDAPDGR